MPALVGPDEDVPADREPVELVGHAPDAQLMADTAAVLAHQLVVVRAVAVLVPDHDVGADPRGPQSGRGRDGAGRGPLLGGPPQDAIEDAGAVLGVFGTHSADGGRGRVSGAVSRAAAFRSDLSMRTPRKGVIDRLHGGAEVGDRPGGLALVRPPRAPEGLCRFLLG